jgi:oligoribonuclease NrnB/cAMP/cGMP phosphodiesterase (DHH superfamily)
MDTCIYHANCYDGFTAAWAVYQRYPLATYIPAAYGDEPPDVTGQDVVIVDFSYPRDVLERMHAQAKSLLVLDHHKTAEAALDGLPYAIFNQTMSGASMAWSYFMSGAPVPKLVQYVEDRDLWKFDLPNSHAINAWIMSHEFNFATWTSMCNTLEDAGGRLTALAAGAALSRAHLKDCHALIQTAVVEVDILGHQVPAVNAPPMMASTIGNILSSMPDVPFSMTYYDTLTERRFSLRSSAGNKAHMDVSEIAKHFGGGGHKHAAGFAIPYHQLPNALYVLSAQHQQAVARAEAPTPIPVQAVGDTPKKKAKA